MSSEQVHVALVAGDGVVARRGVGLMVVLPGGADEVRGSLLTAFEEACAEGDTPGRGLARRLVGLLSQNDPDQLPPFGACAPIDRGWAVILHQGVALQVASDDGLETISGYDASTWVDRIITGDFNALSMTADGQAPPEVDGRFRLDSGVVPGAGATIMPRHAVPAPRTHGTPASSVRPSEPQESTDAGPEPTEAAAVPAPEPDATPDDGMGHDQAIVSAEGGQPEAGQAGQAHPDDTVATPITPATPATPTPPTTPTPPITPAAPTPTPTAPPASTPTPAAPPPTAAPTAIPGGFAPTPTPSADAEQQGVSDAPPAAQDMTEGVPDPDSDEAGHVDEDEPPTLIQAPSREASEPAPLDTSPEPEAMPEEDVAFESVPLTDIGESAKREALPVLTVDTPKEETEDADAPLVHGVMSPAGYFNHPDALYCAVTGVAMLHRTHVLVERPRPPLGVVVADDGSTFTLNSGYVVGREPERDPLVEDGEARPLKLQDAERSLSRVHAEIRLQDWDVVVVDRGSANGTYVLPRGAQQWKRLVADVEEKIVPGTRVAFGKRVVTYESHHQINQAAS